MSTTTSTATPMGKILTQLTITNRLDEGLAARGVIPATAVRSEAPGITRVLGGISPIDPCFVQRLQSLGATDALDALAVHGFPLDWNHWQLDEWPARLQTIRDTTDLPVWVSEVGASSFGA